MGKVDNATLSDFAKSLLVRARLPNAATSVGSPETLPQNTSNEALHKALTAQHDTIEMLTARFTAEINILAAVIERMERELAIAKGQVASVSSLQNAHTVSMQRVVADVHDLGETFVERLNENFEQRIQALSAGR